MRYNTRHLTDMERAEKIAKGASGKRLTYGPTRRGKPTDEALQRP
jgi:hypothetical protein